MSNINEYIKSLISDAEPKLISIRRYLHANPELSFEEYNTQKYICSYLDNIGIEYTEMVGTGVAALIKGSKVSDNPRTLLIRADIDALPIKEQSNKEYSSNNNGIMHACGHDAHTAILLGVCEILNNIRESFSGCVKLVFQPGEETTGGAKPMIDAGVLSDPKVDACVALHVDPDINTGSIRIKPGSLYASPDDFSITITGRGGHGAEPHNCIDPINISAHIITALMTLVSREINPFDEAVVSIGSIHSGTATNIIPDTAVIRGTARSLTNEIRTALKTRIGEIANSVCSAYGAKCDYEFVELFPPLINDELVAKQIYSSAIKALGEDKCIWGGKATMAGEDFAYFTQEAPSALFKLGCRNEDLGIIHPLHHSSFDIDEACLGVGVTAFVGFALDFLN